ncbi:hypothetical protein GCM10010199_64930 [Dactylosporangium roseum]
MRGRSLGGPLLRPDHRASGRRDPRLDPSTTKRPARGPGASCRVCQAAEADDEEEPALEVAAGFDSLVVVDVVSDEDFSEDFSDAFSDVDVDDAGFDVDDERESVR